MINSLQVKKLNTHLIDMVTILNDRQYHDGDTLGEKLNMTRSAVWKAIKKLQRYGIQIDAVKGKGYILLEPLQLLDGKQIKKNILSAWRKQIDLRVFESLTSTNDYLKMVEHTKPITICLAEQQTQGKGRLGRVWHSPFGKNVYLSFRYPFQKDMSELAGLSLVVSLAVINALEKYIQHDELVVKWPNDVLFKQQKLSGSLIEIQAESHGVSCAIIGVGVNVNMFSEEQSISQAWTSMGQILGCAVDRNDLCIHLINQMISYLQRFEQKGFADFREAWEKKDCLNNQNVTLKNRQLPVQGEVVGVNEQGHLLLRLPNNTVQAFSSGEASIGK